jgi:hypothetical protein
MRRLTIAWLITLVPVVATAQTLDDTFDRGQVDPEKWTSRQILPHQIEFMRPGRCGRAAITVVTRDRDGGSDCDESEICQRAELRTAGAFWPPYDGRDTWFAFSFRIDGDIAETGSNRTVIGQWKAPKDSSPFVAQRFDNGVFHITVEDKGVRRVVAKAEGDPDRLLVAQAALSRLSRADAGAVSGVQALQSLFQLKRSRPGFLDRFFSRQLGEALRPQASDPAPATELAEALKLPTPVVQSFEGLGFVAEPERYIGPAEIEILASPKQLPDPRKGWVDMVYRIKGGRTDNEHGPRNRGELEVWANGEKITSVRGNFGNQLKRGDKVDLVGPYFKFGLYRKKAPGMVRFHLDEFSQARTRDGLAPTCPPG